MAWSFLPDLVVKEYRITAESPGFPRFVAKDVVVGGKAMFAGEDSREFWQRAEDRNRDTAKLYDVLGLPEFYALEGFVQWRD